MPNTEKDVCEPERIYARGEAWVECSCGEAVTCSKGREFGHTGHSHSDECLPLVCPGTYRPRLPSERVIPPGKSERGDQ